MGKGYIYLLQEREFISLKKPVFKIGRTGHHPNQRLSKYPKDSELHIVIGVDDHLYAESHLLKKFRLSFVNRIDIGAEYFEGDLYRMKEIIVHYSLGNFENEDQIRASSELIKETVTEDQTPMATQTTSLTELRAECQKIGLPISGTKEQLQSKLDLYRSIRDLSDVAIITMGKAVGIKINKTGKQARLEYIKKFVKIKRDSDRTEKPVSPGVTDKKDIEKTEEVTEEVVVPGLETRLQQMEEVIKNLELKVISQQMKINSLEEKVKNLEDLIKTDTNANADVVVA